MKDTLDNYSKWLLENCLQSSDCAEYELAISEYGIEYEGNFYSEFLEEINK